jgi:CNT family concentrative nucleoside transporter
MCGWHNHPGIGGFMLQLQSAFGVVALLAIAWALGENRRAVSLKQAAIGLAVTLATAIVLLKLPVVARAFGAINNAVGAISAASRAGTSFVFGYIGGGPLPFDLKTPGADFILAFQALPIILVMSVLTTLLFYWGILPPIVKGFAYVLNRTMGVGGAVGLSTGLIYLAKGAVWSGGVNEETMYFVKPGGENQAECSVGRWKTGNPWIVFGLGNKISPRQRCKES